ncbi:hypothetical protein, partial [Mycobacterium tuberculosis]|uniref:hypothetical protein n=1 Tax=Mycobacterium tuberculosis TaxID=1773 RepID=UPI001AE1F8BC|nr:hypothetical protein [Mycobacterium tuberculosis]
RRIESLRREPGPPPTPRHRSRLTWGDGLREIPGGEREATEGRDPGGRDQPDPRLGEAGVDPRPPHPCRGCEGDEDPAEVVGEHRP